MDWALALILLRVSFLNISGLSSQFPGSSFSLMGSSFYWCLLKKFLSSVAFDLVFLLFMFSISNNCKFCRQRNTSSWLKVACSYSGRKTRSLSIVIGLLRNVYVSQTVSAFGVFRNASPRLTVVGLFQNLKLDLLSVILGLCCRDRFWPFHVDYYLDATGLSCHSCVLHGIWTFTPPEHFPPDISSCWSVRP